MNAGVRRRRIRACATAAAAFRERLPKLAEVVKAISIAELEVEGAYVDARHDPFFEHFDDSALGADDVGMFPDYLVCIPADRNDAPENAGLIVLSLFLAIARSSRFALRDELISSAGR